MSLVRSANLNGMGSYTAFADALAGMSIKPSTPTKPPAKKSPRPRHCERHHQLRVELQHIASSINRTLVVPETLPLDQLYRVIEAPVVGNNVRDWQLHVDDLKAVKAKSYAADVGHV